MARQAALSSTAIAPTRRVAEGVKPTTKDPSHEMPDAPRRPSKRELKKADKLQRIKEASVALFLTKGYDEATTREIAKLAGVALGTIFVYAKNKRDLPFLIFNDDLEAALVAAENSVKKKGKFTENLASIAFYHLNYYGRRPQLSRYALREMYFYEDGVQARRFQDIRHRLLGLFETVVGWHPRLRAGADVTLIGDMVFALFQYEVRKLLMTETIDISAALESFKQQAVMLQQGIDAD